MSLDLEALLAGLLPSAFWLALVYSRDRYEREPRRLVIGLFVLGVVPLLVAASLEGALRLRPDSRILATALVGAAGVGLIEEGAAFATFWAVCRRSAHLNEPVDGMIYASSVALGFAAFETTLYILGTYHKDLLLGYPAQAALVKAFFVIAPLRAFTGALGHLSFSGITGEAYGRLRTGSGSWHGVLVAYLKAAGLHAAYDLLVVYLVGFLVLLVALAYYVRLFRRALRDSPFRSSQLGRARAGTAAAR
jgi:RsiW-degrading membrane proteinase PrsW (M82 family)